MQKSIITITLCLFLHLLSAQNVMTPELLWQLGRVGAVGITTDNTSVIYRVTTFDIAENTSSSKYYSIPLKGGDATEVEDYAGLVSDRSVSAKSGLKLISKAIKLDNVQGSEVYPDLDKADVQIYNDLMYRHWDTWSDGSYNHVLVVNPETSDTIDIMEGQPFHCPTKPFGGSEDYTWHPDGNQVIYATKQKTGVEYAKSTNTDIFAYNLETKETSNLTEGRMGYDMSPSFSKQGVMAWLSMARDGYEADKNDLIVNVDGEHLNLTANWDGTVGGYAWSENGKKIYFTAATGGTKQLFVVEYPGKSKKRTGIKQVTTGQFDVTGIVGQHGDVMVVTRTDMNHARELYTVSLLNGKMKQLTHVNDDIYDNIDLSIVERRTVETTDGKEMISWVIYPPNFDPAKKYPALLYCQGGPQGALSQFYSFRWNFQLMAAQGYIVVAPNRRGMPGHGVEWNEQISKDWGGQNMQDYLSAIDEMSAQPFVDEDKLGCVGASYGGYSAYYLAGMHEGRFKSFISHDGVFNLQSMYGTTEELFFVNWDLGGPYWDKNNEAAQKSYTQFNPINHVDKWDTPILIIQGGTDFRVPIGQGLEAFQAARTRGIQSRILHFPNENHWVMKAQNGLVWQREFFGWLSETLEDKS
ncbi:MAG: S9 family peptidase [Bacteroidetes bacterium]|nr:MAG: S9 family peptidase [Bacteroidota bacterium]